MSHSFQAKEFRARLSIDDKVCTHLPTLEEEEEEKEENDGEEDDNDD
jgi:hypothetical protein